MLESLGALPEEVVVEEEVNDNESKARGLQYDEGDEAALRRVPPRTRSISTFWENNSMQVESDSSSEALEKVTETDVVLIETQYAAKHALTVPLAQGASKRRSNTTKKKVNKPNIYILRS